jgi:hypothetical protein
MLNGGEPVLTTPTTPLTTTDELQETSIMATKSITLRTQPTTDRLFGPSQVYGYCRVSTIQHHLTTGGGLRPPFFLRISDASPQD